MNKLAKQMTVLALTGTMLCSMAVFADDTTTTTSSDTTSTQTVQKQKPEKGVRPDGTGEAPSGERPDGERPDHNGSDMMGPQLEETVILYAPALAASYDTAIAAEKEAKDAIRELQKTKMDSTTVDSSRTEYQALLTEIKEALLAGTMTRDEAKTKLDAYKTAQKAERDATKDSSQDELKALKESYGITADAEKTLMDNLKTAITANDDTAISATITAIIDSINNHTAYDKAVYELLSSK